MKIFEDRSLTVEIRRRRTWRERLFTRPWRPLEEFSSRHEPDPNVIVLPDGNVIAHPVTARALVREGWGAEGLRTAYSKGGAR